MPSLPGAMQAMCLLQQGGPLVHQEVPVPVPAAGQVVVQVLACGVCRTDLHILDGELAGPKLPLIPGHEIIGRVVQSGNNVKSLHQGNLVGIPWLAYTCGHCRYCRQGQENLCEQALFTGYTHDGGFAGYILAYERFCFPLPAQYSHPRFAPLLCAGLIGYRSYTTAGEGVVHLGLYGFGAAAHILL